MTESAFRLFTDPADVRHGTPGAYTNHGCRCEKCKAANAEAQRSYRARRAAREVPWDVHGTVNGYANWLCRCNLCRAAHTKMARKVRARRTR